MGTRHVAGLPDVQQGRRPSRLRLLAPLRYLAIQHPEKSRYDFIVPAVFTAAAWALFTILDPKPAIFGDAGLLKYARDLLMMTVPFLVGALAAVAMGTPGAHFDRRPVGGDLYLNGEALTLRQFVCYLLGYLSFVGLFTLIACIAAELFRPSIVGLLVDAPLLKTAIKLAGALLAFWLIAVLVVTTLWALYFLTDVANRK
jgi:hypothetical protein